ncbi:regulator of G-protein signaling protein-like isoform X3 [Mus musculus]|uniref:regulator of G-protein signaling protein-like isoform X3 n=1 Tax=Mus musculus TaxID=10090 RepID=UPI0003D72B24|nr:regulator of G-protein signaling protein-like isoform X3 [Mus musculus]|eukprot:XP_006529640.1 PREDICTED: regulator of G-protein signaling protein-like isoform X3 [Mus musculus]
MGWNTAEASPCVHILFLSGPCQEEHGNMSNADIICSTNLIILLEDETFADFFNTFLSLPVFGQTPFYNVEKSQWSLWPEVPYDLIAKYKGLLTWLEKYRLPFFCKTNLCFYYILSQELVSFLKSPEGAKMMRWNMADQWLLQKCIAGVRGMWRFCSYLKGSAGEELLDFWILAEKILSIDETDKYLKDYYLSLLLVLKATHLQEGSRVVTLCNMDIKSLLNLSIWHPNQSTTRREILSHMQKVALFKIQSYWLPNFYTHAKMTMANEEACHGLMQEYETRLYSVCCAHAGGLPLNMSIKKSRHSQKKYSSKKAKKKIWHLNNPILWPLETDAKPEVPTKPQEELSLPERVVLQKTSLGEDSSKETIIHSLCKDLQNAKKPIVKKKSKIQLHMEGFLETAFTNHLRSSTPIINHAAPLVVKKSLKRSLSFGYTHWALCADACAGSPFRFHLKKMNLKVEVQLLDLWQDLQHFISVLMNNRQNGNALFRHMLGNRICELYLNEQIGPPLPLKPQTLQGLKKLLPSGEVNPWIPKAQREICKVLSPWYDEFLMEEDYWFLIFTTQTRFAKARWHKRETISKEEHILLYKRLQESLVLSQALASMQEIDSMQWQKVATENLRQGGSLQVELTTPVFLQAFTVEIIRQPKYSYSQRKTSFVKKSVVRKPSMRPRNLTEVLLNNAHLEYFKEFLKDRKSESPLQFLIAVQKIMMETNEKTYKTSLENITKTYLHGKVPAEEILQCDAPFIKEIANVRHITTTTLLMLQGYVMKSVEEKWFKEYQDLFPPRSVEFEFVEAQAVPRKPSKSTTHLHDSQKRGWIKMIAFIKSFCNYRRFIADANNRQELADFIYLEMFNNKENFSTSPATSARHTPVNLSARNAEQENGDTVLVKRRIFGHRIITINFAVNDMYLFSEMERFNDLVSSAHMLQINRAYNENDIILMRSKLNIIVKLYLVSDLPPKLKVNISESQKDIIISAITEGHLDRTIFHGAIMSIFPVIMYFWKRFCNWKATRSYVEYLGKKFEDGRNPPKSVYKYPPWSGGEHTVLRFSLLRGVEWFRPQHPRDAVPSSLQPYQKYPTTKKRRSNQAKAKADMDGPLTLSQY